jgi:hypothetical protein
MRLNVDRLCRLAGINSSERGSGLIRETFEMEASEDEEGEIEESLDEEQAEDEDMIEIDERVLVQELRRARRIMNEGKRKARQQKRRSSKVISEMKLKAVIDQEVKNVLKELNLNLNSDWIYGKNKPKRSKKGYLNHGSYLKGIGFK